MKHHLSNIAWARFSHVRFEFLLERHSHARAAERLAGDSILSGYGV